MVRRAGIHRIAAVVARRASADGASTSAPSILAQLDLFASEVADPQRMPVLPANGEHGALGPAHLDGEQRPARSTAADPAEGDEHDDEREAPTPANVVHVTACPMCTWWVSRASTRCECCGVGLLDGALAPQAELSFLDAPTSSPVDGEAGSRTSS